jgi:hypothetical protein
MLNQLDTMKTKPTIIPLSCLLLTMMLGCATDHPDHYRYSGSLASAEQAIANSRPKGNIWRLPVEARGEIWVRYRVIYGSPLEQPVTNGVAILRVAHGEASVSGADAVRLLIREALSDK